MMIRKCVLWAMMIGAGSSPALASRTAVEGRGLPRNLAVDVSILRSFPGSARLFVPQLGIDYAPDRPEYVQGTMGSHRFTGSDRFGVAMVGAETRFAYVVDGTTQNLLLGTQGGFGAVLGFSDRFSKDERTTRTYSGTASSESYQEDEYQRTDVRLGLGFQSESGSGNLFDISAGGSYVHAEQGNRLVLTSTSSSTSRDFRWQSDPGFVLDGAVRMVPRGSGFMLAAAYVFQELNPDIDLPVPVTTESHRGSLDLAWRMETARVDDIVVGWTSTYSRVAEFRLRASGSVQSAVEETMVTSYRGGLFLSGEHRVIEQLQVRAGVQALATFTDTESRDWLLDETGNLVSEQEVKDSSGQVEPPQIFLGAGYRWKSLRLDVQVRESINLDSPFVRWAATVIL